MTLARRSAWVVDSRLLGRIALLAAAAFGYAFIVMGPTVYNQFAGLTNWPFGAPMSFVLMTATLLLTVTSNWLAQARYRR